MKREKVINLINRVCVRRNIRKIGLLLLVFIIGSFSLENEYKADVDDFFDKFFEVTDWSAKVLEDESLDPLPNSTLYARVPASQSIIGEDVCVYVTNYRSQEYLDAVNSERALWGVAPVSYSQDLEEGAMLRAGEEMEEEVKGNMLDPHETYDYPTPAWENAFDNTSGYLPLSPFDYWVGEKEYLPSDYTPQKYGYIGDNNGYTVGHYATMVAPQIKYIGQGASYADPGCDGGKVGTHINYYEEHYVDSTDLYPDLNSAISVNLGSTVSSSSSGNYTSNAMTSNISNNTVTSSNEYTFTDVDESAEKEKLEQEKIAEENKLKEQQEKEFEVKQKENEERRAKEALLNDKTHKHRDVEALTTAGKNHFMAMMMWALVISGVYFVGSKLLYLRNK